MKLIASFDDGTAQDIRIAELMTEFDIETIFYWPVNTHLTNEIHGRTSLTDKQMNEIAKYFEVGSHTVTHPLLTRIDFESARKEIFESRIILQNKFSQNIDSFCYPRGYSNPAVQEAVIEAGYTNARSTLVGYVHESENPYFIQTAVHVACDRKEYAGMNWFDYGMKLLEIARKIPDSVFHLWGHSWEIDKNSTWNLFELFLHEATS